MKRMLVWLILFAMLFAATPVANAALAPTYSKSDIMTAVSGMGRMPSNYYNLAGIGLESIPNITSSMAENFTKKMYTVWAFLAQHAYVYNGNKTVSQVLTLEQLNAVTSYLYKLDETYGTSFLSSQFLAFLNSTKTYKLVKPGVPRSLLGVQFDAATTSAPATVKVYTTANVTGEVYLANASGERISTNTKVITYPGTLASFKEFILTVDYEYVGKNAVRLYGVDAAYPQEYFSTKATVSGPNVSGSTGSNPSASVKKVSAATAELGTPSMITVTTSTNTTDVKITNKNGALLASSDTPATTTATSKTFVVPYSFSSSGTQSIRAYAGTLSGATILWNKSFKKASVKVSPAASSATISRVSAKSVLRGQEATIKVYASSKVTRVQLFDAGGDMVDFTRDHTTSGKLRVFTLHYRNNAAGSYKLSVQAGNDINWNSSKKKVTVKFTSPVVTSIRSTRVRKGNASTITVMGSATATRAKLYTSRNVLIGEVDIADGKFTFSWTQTSAGRKTVYAQVYDGFGWGPRKSGSVTFT